MQHIFAAYLQLSDSSSCTGLTHDSADGVEGHRAHGSQVVGMDRQHGLPVVGPAVRGAGVAEAVRVELRRPRIDDGANAVALQHGENTVRTRSGRGGTWHTTS